MAIRAVIVPVRRSTRTPLATASTVTMRVAFVMVSFSIVSNDEVVVVVLKHCPRSSRYCSCVRQTAPRSIEWLHEESVIEVQLKLPPFCTVQLLIGTNPGGKVPVDTTPARTCTFPL